MVPAPAQDALAIAASTLASPLRHAATRLYFLQAMVMEKEGKAGISPLAQIMVNLDLVPSEGDGRRGEGARDPNFMDFALVEADSPLWVRMAAPRLLLAEVVAALDWINAGKPERITGEQQEALAQVLDIAYVGARLMRAAESTLAEQAVHLQAKFGMTQEERQQDFLARLADTANPLPLIEAGLTLGHALGIVDEERTQALLRVHNTEMLRQGFTGGAAQER